MLTFALIWLPSIFGISPAFISFLIICGAIIWIYLKSVSCSRTVFH
jgi:hypothetical protein